MYLCLYSFIRRAYCLPFCILKSRADHHCLNKHTEDCKERFMGSLTLGGTLKSVQSNPLLCSEWANLDQVDEGFVQSSFDNLCGWTSLQTIWATYASVQQAFWCKMLLSTKSEFPLLKLMLIVSCSTTSHPQVESSSDFSVTSHQMVEDSNNTFPHPFPFSK